MEPTLPKVGTTNAGKGITAAVAWLRTAADTKKCWACGCLHSAFVLADPFIRFVVVCGADSRQMVGHLPGQSLIALAHQGTNAERRIIGAKGKRPVRNFCHCAHSRDGSGKNGR